MGSRFLNKSSDNIENCHHALSLRREVRECQPHERRVKIDNQVSVVPDLVEQFNLLDVFERHPKVTGVEDVASLSLEHKHAGAGTMASWDRGHSEV